MILQQLDKHRDLGLLILRVGIGLMFILHGYPKLFGGPDVWAKLGSVLSFAGINFAPGFFGFMAAFAEFGGGLLLILGLFTRPALILLFITMVVATLMHVTNGDSFMKYSHALESAILFFSLIWIGPGKYALDQKFKN